MRVCFSLSISPSMIASRAEEVTPASVELINIVFSPLIVSLQRSFLYLTLNPSAVLKDGGSRWLSTSMYP